MISALLTSVRPKQWIKNLIIFAALVFSKNLFNQDQFVLVFLAFALFCFLSGSVYLLNDLLDIEKDKQHPIKCKRPLPSGKLSPKVAVFALVLMSSASLATAFMIEFWAGVIASVYFVNNLLYSTFSKHIVIVDVMQIAFGFVLRVLIGAVVIGVPASPWLLMCTVVLALFLGFAKRKHELILLSENAESHRKVLEQYTIEFLDQMIVIVSSATVMSYALYTIWPDTVEHFGTSNLIYTVPFVLYGLFRYLYLVNMKEEGGSPTRVLLTDKPLLLNIMLWLVFCILFIEDII